jgi:glycosyltransferase involved in cell wall biosynthesis
VRVLQLIDTLNPGGAEQMAVNIANALNLKIEHSSICSTRGEGFLKSKILSGVKIMFLKKRFVLDLSALWRLRQYIVKNKIDVVHAHSSSYFFASLLKILGLKFKLIWHDHYGESDFLDNRKTWMLKIFSYYFDGVISVNSSLHHWAMKELNCLNIIEINNFIFVNQTGKMPSPILKGSEEEFKIICVANLRPQKDIKLLLEAFEIFAHGKNCSLHLIGENPGTEYANSVLEFIELSKVKNKIRFYGPQLNVRSLMSQADLGVLVSRSEGLPLVLLEYGLCGIPIICTDVGKCREVLGDFGIIIQPAKVTELVNALNFNYNNITSAIKLAYAFQTKVHSEFTEESCVNKILEFYQNINYYQK